MGGEFIYSLVARGQVVLVEYTESIGNFPTVTQVLLRRICQQNRHTTQECTKFTITHDNHNFHYIKNKGSSMLYMCMTASSVKTTIAFAMLSEVKREFDSKFSISNRENAIAYGMNRSFRSSLCTIMKRYNSDDVKDPLDMVNYKLHHVKNLMVENITRVLERGEELDLLVERSDRLKNRTFDFGRTAEELKGVHWWRNVRCWVYLGITTILVAWFILSEVCGGIDIYASCTGAADSQFSSIQKTLRGSFLQQRSNNGTNF